LFSETYIITSAGRVVIRALRRMCLPAEEQVRNHTSPYGICRV